MTGGGGRRGDGIEWGGWEGEGKKEVGGEGGGGGVGEWGRWCWGRGGRGGRGGGGGGEETLREADCLGTRFQNIILNYPSEYLQGIMQCKN